MQTSIYIDGFNLYYGILKDTPYRWLNISSLCNHVYPDLASGSTTYTYYTARLKPRPNNPDQHFRQHRYLRALRTISGLNIVYGHFLTHPAIMPRFDPPHRPVKVLKTQEKGSDVNLAVDLLSGGFRGTYDQAIVVSNDSDLARAITVVQKELQKPVFILNPYPHSPSKALKNCATSVRQIRKSALAKSQFPATLEDARGKFHRPGTWL